MTTTPTNKLQDTVDQWNRANPIGSYVLAYELINPRRIPRVAIVRSEAWVIGGHSAVVKVTGQAGGVNLDSILSTKPLVLISCSKEKQEGSHAARSLYQGLLFKKSVAWAENRGLDWAVLSARYGLVHPDKIIASYDQTLTAMNSKERDVWSRRVRRELKPFAKRPLIVLAGKTCCGWIDPEFGVERPLKGLFIGQQLQYLTENAKP